MRKLDEDIAVAQCEEIRHSTRIKNTHLKGVEHQFINNSYSGKKENYDYDSLHYLEV